MKRLFLAVVALVVVAFTASAVAIIPQPQSVVMSNRSFTVERSTAIYYEAKELAPLAKYMQEYLDIEVATKKPKRNYIAILLDKHLAEEEYCLTVGKRGVRIVAGGYGGAFNGVQTLFQLLPSAVYTKQMKLPATVQGCEVKDAPKFAYRGFMLDVARTFITKENILRYIDYLAYHKINKLHWHLVDNQGWRIEIKSHPNLTKIGGFRGGDSPLRPSHGKWNEKYGGYYTQDEIREVVAYATVRNVEIIPEIDLPGHSEALARVYPEVLCNYTNTELNINGNYDNRNVVCATKESNYKLLEEILSEVCALFPSKHFHIGGDEVNMSQWKRCPDCSAWLKERGYTDGYKLEDMFISRIQTILAKYGKSPSVWNEAAFGGGLSKEAWVHGWKSPKICKQVMAKGYPTIFMPQQFFYFDMRQSEREPGAVWGGCFDVRKVYSFDFVKEGFTPEQVAQVKGFEAAAWSEAFLSQGGDKSIDFIEYQTFPRICALAEHCWGKNGGGEWEEFQKRLYTRHYDRLSDMDINFRITPSDVKYEGGVLSVVKIDNCNIYYREDGSSKVYNYSEPIQTSVPGKFVFWSEYRGHKSPEFAHSSRYETIKPTFTLTSSMPMNPKYGFDKVMTYKSEARTSRACVKGDWFLYEFEKPLECRAVEFYAGYFAMPSRCFPSGYIEVSEDGVNFKRVADLKDGKVLLENPRPIKAARLVSTGDLIGTGSVRFVAPKVYPKW